MKTFRIKDARPLNREEMRTIVGSRQSEELAAESCAYYSGCSTGCARRYLSGGGNFQYRCSYCCVA